MRIRAAESADKPDTAPGQDTCTKRPPSDTADDLLAHASEQGEGVPPLLVLTFLVQLLKRVRALHERGLHHGDLTPARLLFAERSIETLWNDPSRDPRLRILPAGSDSVPADFAPASDIHQIGALALALFSGGSVTGPPRWWWGPLRPFRSLLEGMLHPRPEARWTAARALDEARRLAMEHFEAWDNSRRAELVDREALLRHQLTEAIYLEREPDAAWHERQLRYFLGGRAEADGDLTIAQFWLAERAELAEGRREASRRSRLKILLTGMPLLLAMLLTVLLAVVLLMS